MVRDLLALGILHGSHDSLAGPLDHGFLAPWRLLEVLSFSLGNHDRLAGNIGSGSLLFVYLRHRVVSAGSSGLCGVALYLRSLFDSAGSSCFWVFVLSL